MLRRWLIAFLRHGGISLITELLTSLACDQQLVAPWVHGPATAVGICSLDIVTKIPSLFFSSEIKGVVVPTSSLMPDTLEMSKNRLELGKLMIALEFVNTTQSKLALEAVRRFDDHSRKTIRSIGRLNTASQLTANRIVHILDNLIDNFNRVSTKSKFKSRFEIHQLVTFHQVQIDAFVESIQGQLKQLFQVAITAQEDLDACDNHIQQIFMTAGNYLNDHQDAKDKSNRAWPWAAAIFDKDGSDLRGVPVAKAIEHFVALVKATQRANEIVAGLSGKLVEIIGGIEAAYRYPDKMTVINMSMEETIEVALQMLVKLRQEVQAAQAVGNARE